MVISRIVNEMWISNILAASSCLERTLLVRRFRRRDHPRPRNLPVPEPDVLRWLRPGLPARGPRRSTGGRPFVRRESRTAASVRDRAWPAIRLRPTDKLTKPRPFAEAPRDTVRRDWGTGRRRREAVDLSHGFRQGRRVACPGWFRTIDRLSSRSPVLPMFRRDRAGFVGEHARSGTVRGRDNQFQSVREITADPAQAGCLVRDRARPSQVHKQGHAYAAEQYAVGGEPGLESEKCSMALEAGGPRLDRGREDLGPATDQPHVIRIGQR